MRIIVSLLLICTIVFSANAQTSTVPAESAGSSAVAAQNVGDVQVPGTVIPWKQILHNGGWLMYVLAAMSLLTLTFVIYFFLVLRVSQISPEKQQKELIEKIESGNLEDAKRICEYRRTPLSEIILSAIVYLENSHGNAPALLKDIMEGEGQRQAESIQGQTQYLLDIAAVSPMIGLLGTVFGMLRAFSSVALDIASAKPVNLAAGVSQALITTAFGLIVSIPAMMFYAYFRRRASKIIAKMEVATANILSVLLAQVNKERD